MGISVGDFLHHSAAHRWLNVQPRSADLSEWPFTLFVRFLSSLTLSVFPYLFYFLTALLSPFLSRQLGPYLSACCLVPSCVYWPLAIPQSPSCQLLYPFFHPSPLLSFCMLSKPSTSVSNALPKTSASEEPCSLCLGFLFHLSTFCLTFYFNVSGCLPSPAGPRFPLLLSSLSCVYIFIFK